MCLRCPRSAPRWTLRRDISPIKMKQLELPTWGGRRKGAGRKPKGPRERVSHKPRPRFDRPVPAHVTLRVREHVWNLRSRRAYRRIRAAFEKARGRMGL